MLFLLADQIFFLQKEKMGNGPDGI